MEIYSYDPLEYNADVSGQVTLWQEHGEEYSGIWALRAGRADNQRRPQNHLTTLVACIFIIALAKFIYIRLDRRRQPPGEDYPVNSGTGEKALDG